MENKKLKNLFKLGSRIQVYVPSTVNVDVQVDNTEVVNRVASELASWFGGATSTQALGYWNSASAGLVSEKTTIVFAYCTSEQLENNIEKLVELCENLKIEMTQEAIALEINGELYFV